MQDISPFDLRRMFIGPHDPLFLVELVVRVVILYIYAVALIRLMGKRAKQQMTPLEYIILIALGSAAGDPMLYPQVSILMGMTVITMLVLVNHVLSVLKEKIPALQQATESDPLILLKDGALIKKHLQQSRFTEKELFSQLREQGVSDLGQVKLAILEISGKVSVFTYPQAKRKQIRSILPRSD